MENFLSLIKNRHSEREFSEKGGNFELSNEVLDNLIKNVPKAGGIECVVVKKADSTLRTYCELAGIMQKALTNAKDILIVGIEKPKLESKYGDQWANDYANQNCALVAYNIILYLTEQKIDTCYVGGFSKQLLVEKQNLNYTPYVLIAVGGAK